MIEYAYMLSNAEIKDRLKGYENYKKLNTQKNIRIRKLVAENKALKVRVEYLEKVNGRLNIKIDDLSYQMAQLQAVVFGKKRKVEEVIFDNEDDNEIDDKEDKPPRNNKSYKRPIPKEDEITETIRHSFNKSISKEDREVLISTYYIEDIPLHTKKTVTKLEIERYYDKHKNCYVSAVVPPHATVTFGNNIRVLISSLNTVQRLTYSQIQTLLSSLYNINVSDGEIANILEKESVLLQSANDALISSIQKEASIHMDETRHDIKGETGYAWSMTGGTIGDTVYVLGKSRGKGIADSLYKDSKSILISDDYGVYRNLSIERQLCWAHIIRKFRDLKEHDAFSDTCKIMICELYKKIKIIYSDLVTFRKNTNAYQLFDEFALRLKDIATIRINDPIPLIRLKKTLSCNIPYYLTGLKYPNIALTNNIAEQALRHIVLKRRMSHGSKSKKGANVMSVLFTVIMSLFRKNPKGYLGAYLELRRV